MVILFVLVSLQPPGHSTSTTSHSQETEVHTAEYKRSKATNNTRRFHQEIINLRQDVIKIKKDRTTNRSCVAAFKKKLRCSRLCPVLHQSRFGQRKRNRLMWGVNEWLWRTQPLRYKAYIGACLYDESEPGSFEDFIRDYEELYL